MRKLLKVIIFIGFVVSITSGCAANHAISSVDSTTNLSALRTMHVKKNPTDEKDIDVLIADKLRSKGVAVTNGSEAPPSSVDATVTYIDKWTWDITMYMRELTIIIRDPKTDFPLASGNSLHSSLTRLSPTEMVNEVVDNIYKGTNK